VADAAPQEAQREMLTLVTARIRDAYLRKPIYVDGSADLVSVCRALSAAGLTQALVRDGVGAGARLGIFTTTDLRDALLRPEPPGQLPVREVARFELVEVQADADLFEALWLMVSHRVQRLVVRDGEGADAPVLGVLGQVDLVSFVANHSNIVVLEIDDAASVSELKTAASRSVVAPSVRPTCRRSRSSRPASKIGDSARLRDATRSALISTHCT
jgi:CBS domain-containing protein